MIPKIEKHVPIPTNYNSGHRERKYPTDKMDVGDSFAISVVDKTKEQIGKLRISLLASARFARTKGKFITHYDKEKQEVRCWRIA